MSLPSGPTPVGEQLAFRAVHVQERFLLAFAKDKMRDGLSSWAIASPWPGAFGLAAGFTVQAAWTESERNKEKTSNCFMTKVCADDACTAVAVKLGLKAQVAPWWLRMRIFSFAFIIPSATLVEMNWGLPISICPSVHRGFGRSGATLWSLERLQKPAAPAVEIGADADGRIHYRKLQAANLSPQPKADRHTLIRRLTLGLRPAADGGRDGAVCGDTKPGAYDVWSIRLLAKPAFGERWGRHWLDVVRFGESSGELTVNDDKPRSNAWRFRDAVIRRSMRCAVRSIVRFHFVPDEK